MNRSVSRRKSSSAVARRSALKARTQVVALQAECLYGIERQGSGEAASSPPINGATTASAGTPVLTRYVKCHVALPNDVPLQNTSRIIAMFKCFREMLPTGRNAPTPMIETVFSKFMRIWPKGPMTEEDLLNAPGSPMSFALTQHDSRHTLEFTLPLPANLPQSVHMTGGSISYTLQIQANLRHPSNISEEVVIYSHELSIEVPPPESAYSLSKLPHRITNGIVGQTQDHYGILITPDISLHVSVPREIIYSKRLHSVFKIHIKLMPHPPEAKLPNISRLDWKLRQRTNLGSVQLDRNSGAKRVGVSTTDLASGQVMLSAEARGEGAMSGSRKDQYLYIALPENSPALLPMYYENRYLEILHTLEIELFPAQDNVKTNGFSSFLKTLSRNSKPARQPWKADIPIKLCFDPSEIPRSAAGRSDSVSSTTKASPDRLAIAL